VNNNENYDDDEDACNGDHVDTGTCGR